MRSRDVVAVLQTTQLRYQASTGSDPEQLDVGAASAVLAALKRAVASSPLAFNSVDDVLPESFVDVLLRRLRVLYCQGDERTRERILAEVSSSCGLCLSLLPNMAALRLLALWFATRLLNARPTLLKRTSLPHSAPRISSFAPHNIPSLRRTVRW